MARPLVYQLTNSVSAQLQADCIALLGGASIMSQNLSEAQEIAAAADTLLINTGTPSAQAFELYSTALSAASGKPAVLDLTGYGFASFRTELTDRLLSAYQFSVIKGNGAEIAALAGRKAAPRGVSADREYEHSLEDVVSLSKKFSCVVFATGASDCLAKEDKTSVITGGSSKITALSGIGCALGSAVALFCAKQKPFSAAERALTLFRKAATEADEDACAPYSLRVRFMDRLYRLKSAEDKNDE